MESLLFALIVLVPGMTVLKIIQRKVPGSRKSMSQIEEISKLSIYGALTFVITHFVMRLVGISFISLEIFNSKLNNIQFLTKYILLTAFVTYFIGILLSADFYIENKLIIKNWLRKLNDKCEESEFVTAWDEIFENHNNKIHQGIIIKIIKNGIQVTQGEVQFYNPPDAGIHQIKLVNTETIRNFFLYDLECENEADKFFGNPVYELYDIDKDVLIKFYNPDKYIKYCQEFIS